MSTSVCSADFLRSSVNIRENTLEPYRMKIKKQDTVEIGLRESETETIEKSEKTKPFMSQKVFWNISLSH